MPSTKVPQSTGNLGLIQNVSRPWKLGDICSLWSLRIAGSATTTTAMERVIYSVSGVNMEAVSNYRLREKARKLKAGFKISPCADSSTGRAMVNFTIEAPNQAVLSVGKAFLNEHTPAMRELTEAENDKAEARRLRVISTYGRDYVHTPPLNRKSLLSI